VLVDELLVVGDQGLGQGLADGVDLRGVATTSHPDADVDLGELVKTNDEDGLVDLEAEDLRLKEVKRTAVDLDEAGASLAVGDGGGRLLLAEALDALSRHDYGGCRVGNMAE